MSNRNTIADVILAQNNGAPLTIAATTTLHRAFGATSGATGAAALSIPNPMALIDSSAPFPGRAAVGLAFRVRAAGTVTGGENFTIDINSPSSSLSQTIASTGNIGLGDAYDNWYVEATCLWDPTSLFLRGSYKAFAGNVYVAEKALAQVVSPANLAALTFNCAVTIINANVNASFSLTDFSADLV